MPFTRPTLQEIHDRIIADIEARMTDNAPLLLVALLRILAKVFAAAIHIVYGVLVWLGRMIIVNTAETDWLGKHATEWGLTRKASTFAVGAVIFTGIDTTIIPEGTLVQNEAGSEYETTAEGTISSGEANIAVKAVLPGVDSNFLKDAPLDILETTLVSPITGIDSLVLVDGEITGGLDEETDEDLRTRILERIQLQPAGGAEHDYIRWAKEVDGVEDAWAFGNYYGGGTVAVVIKPENPTLVAQVDAYIDPRRPVTAAVTVLDIDPVSVHFDISLDPNDVPTQEAIKTALRNLFEDEGVPGGLILWTHITSAIASSGVFDYEITQVIVGLAVWTLGDDLTFNNFEFPQLGATNWSDL